MAKTYKNLSGTYSEDDLVVAVWFNPQRKGFRPNARYLETIISKDSPHPVAFPLALLQKNKPWSLSTVVTKSKDINTWLTPEKASKEKPLLVSLSIAKSFLGWEDFYIPLKYKETM
jgi:hypothetical protein